MLARGVGRSLRAGTAAIFGRSRADPAAAKPATPLLTLRWTFSAKRACVVVTDSKPDGFAPLPRQRPWASAGFRWWRRAVAPAQGRGVLDVPAQTWASCQGAGSIQSTAEGSPQRRAQQAGEFEAGAGAGGCCASRAAPPSRRS